MLALFVISVFLLFRKKKESYVFKTKDEIQDLLARSDAKIFAAVEKEKIEAIRNAQEELKKVLPIIYELQLSKLVEANKRGEVNDKEFEKYSNKLLDLRNEHYNNAE